MDLKEQLRNDAEQYRKVGWLNFAQLLMAAADRIHQLEYERESSEHALTPAMVQVRNGQLNTENAQLRDRIKKLEAQTLEDSQELGKLDSRIEALEKAGDAIESDKKELLAILRDLGVSGTIGNESTQRWCEAKETKP